VRESLSVYESERERCVFESVRVTGGVCTRVLERDCEGETETESVCLCACGS